MAGHEALTPLARVDNGHVDVMLPFQFWWYGDNHTTIRVHTNGWIQVGAGDAWSDAPVTASNASNTAAGIAVMWADWCVLCTPPLASCVCFL